MEPAQSDRYVDLVLNATRPTMESQGSHLQGSSLMPDAEPSTDVEQQSQARSLRATRINEEASVDHAVIEVYQKACADNGRGDAQACIAFDLVPET